MLNEVNQMEKDKYCVISLYVWNLKYDTKISLQNTVHRHRQQTYAYHRGRVGERINWELNY